MGGALEEGSKKADLNMSAFFLILKQLWLEQFACCCAPSAVIEGSSLPKGGDGLWLRKGVSRCSSLVACLPSVHKAYDSIPITPVIPALRGDWVGGKNIRNSRPFS